MNHISDERYKSFIYRTKNCRFNYQIKSHHKQHTSSATFERARYSPIHTGIVASVGRHPGKKMKTSTKELPSSCFKNYIILIVPFINVANIRRRIVGIKTIGLVM